MDLTSFYLNGPPPTLREVKVYFNQKGIGEREAEHFFLFNEKNQWRNRKGYFMKKWKVSAWKWIQPILTRDSWLFDRNIH